MSFRKTEGNGFCKFHVGDFDTMPRTEGPPLYASGAVVIIINIVINICSYSMYVNKGNTICDTDSR